MILLLGLSMSLVGCSKKEDHFLRYNNYYKGNTYKYRNPNIKYNILLLLLSPYFLLIPLMNYENMVYRFSNDIHIELIQTGMITQIVINSKIYGKILIRVIFFI